MTIFVLWIKFVFVVAVFGSADHMSECNSQALVVFTNANPYAQAFTLPVRPFVIG